MRTALVTGVTGQDGSHLADLLVAEGVRTFGLVRRTSEGTRSRIAHLEGRIELIPGDLLDAGSLRRALEISKPDEVYHLGALSHVGVSFEQPELTTQITGLGALRLLEATRAVRPDARFYQASSSEMFGNAATPTQDECTPFRPVSPYGAAKEFAHRVATMYREAYGMHVSCGILFNHEGPRRGPEFVTRKITVAAARIRAGMQTELVLGDLEARRDFGWAPDYVVAMTLMARRDRPGDYVVATGASRSVREFAERAFDRVGLDWRRYVRSDASLLRPTEVATLTGDASRARRELGWAPTRSFEEIVDMMVDADAARTAKETRA